MSQVTIIDGLRIRTSNDCPPVPSTRYDWSAWVEDQEELVGRGATESDAVAELLQTLAERDGDL